MSKRILAAIVLLIIELFLIYYRFDIISELVGGRKLERVEISQLILPSILLVIIIYFFIPQKKKKDVS